MVGEDVVVQRVTAQTGEIVAVEDDELAVVGHEFLELHVEGAEKMLQLRELSCRKRPSVDEAALQLTLVLDQAPEGFQPREIVRTDGHQHEGGPVAGLVQRLAEGRGVGVHRGDDVRRLAMLGAGEDHRTALFLGLQALVGCRHAEAVVARVAQRPGDDAGVVLVAAVEILDTALEQREVFRVGSHRLLLLGERH